MRKPTEIAADARQQLDTATKYFVPPNLARLGELSVEFMESTAATLDAAGLIPADKPAEPPAGP